MAQNFVGLSSKFQENVVLILKNVQENFNLENTVNIKKIQKWSQFHLDFIKMLQNND